MSSPGPDRRRLLLVYGGRSSEHEVSIRSAMEVVAAVDRHHFSLEVMAIGRDGSFRSGPTHDLEGTAASGELVADLVARLREADVVFPLLHGPWGEDGSFQGLLELLGVPYVGSGVLASALCMDKSAFKTYVSAPEHRIPVTPGMNFEFGPHPDFESSARSALEAVGLPCFVKPANQGSSVGVSKVEPREDEADAEEALADALRVAADFDRRVVVERAIDAREIELAVLGNGGPETFVTQPGEISLPAGTWYDYEAKYESDVASLAIPAELPAETIELLQEISVRAFRAVGARGLARVDFLVDRGDGNVYLNEINTMPGFTTISMYPKLMNHCGVEYAELITRLCELAIEHHAARSRLAVIR